MSYNQDYLLKKDIMKQNCWEFKNCGRQPGGANTAELGVCPAATDTSFNAYNGGTNGGRICWSVAGSFCENKVQGTFAQKRLSCMECDFYLLVSQEEKRWGKFIMVPGVGQW